MILLLGRLVEEHVVVAIVAVVAKHVLVEPLVGALVILKLAVRVLIWQAFWAAVALPVVFIGSRVV